MSFTSRSELRVAVSASDAHLYALVRARSLFAVFMAQLSRIYMCVYDAAGSADPACVAVVAWLAREDGRRARCIDEGRRCIDLAAETEQHLKILTPAVCAANKKKFGLK